MAVGMSYGDALGFLTDVNTKTAVAVWVAVCVLSEMWGNKKSE